MPLEEPIYRIWLIINVCWCDQTEERAFIMTIQADKEWLLLKKEKRPN